MDVQGQHEEFIAKVSLIEELQKQADKENYPEQVTGGLYDFFTEEYFKRIKLKKIYFEVNFNYIIFF